MGESRTHARARERIEWLCRSTLDDRALRHQVLAELRHAVGFDAYVWPLTDPRTAVGGAPIADVPCRPELPTLIKLKYLSTINRWTDEPSPARSLRESTGRDLARSLVWRGLLRRYDVGDVASVVFADRRGTWAFLDLWRARAFTDDEVALLNAIAGPVTTALRTRLAQEFIPPGWDASTAESAQRGPGLRGAAVVILDDELRIVTQTAAAREWLHQLLPPGPNQAPIPAAAYNTAAQLLATERGVDRHDASTRVALGDGGFVTLRAARLEGGNTIAVTIEESSTVDRIDLFAGSHGLSTRERELLALLAEGRDSAELARAMHITEHTVQDHFKSVFAKTSVNNRRSLLATVLGTQRVAQ